MIQRSRNRGRILIIFNGEVKEGEKWRRNVTSKWIRLVSPVKTMRASSIVSKEVFGLVVVF
jgi:hypothetical protein